MFGSDRELVDFATFYLSRILPLRRRIMTLQGNLALYGLQGGAFSRTLVDQLDTELEELDTALWA